jgi:hypothetical protein
MALLSHMCRSSIVLSHALLHPGKPPGLSGVLMMHQKAYVMAIKTKTTRACPTHSGNGDSVSSSSLVAIEDWSGKVVP